MEKTEGWGGRSCVRPTPGHLGQASEHLALRTTRAGRAGAAEAGQLTAPYVRLSATTSFAWFWCGCCAI